MQPLNNAAVETHGRIHQLITQLPLATCIILLINILVFFSESLLELNLMDGSLCALPLEAPYYQFYRIFTNAFMHVNFIHLAMNMLYVYTMCAMIEKQLGTLTILAQQLLFTVFIGIVYVLITHIMIFITQDSSYLAHCGVGYSGIIFTYAVIDVVLRPDGQRSIFGFFTVPAYLYPISLLIIISIVIPNVSWLGHLSGLIVGWLYCKGLLLPFTLPRNTVKTIENKLIPDFIKTLPNYTPYPEHDYLQYQYVTINLYDTLITPVVAKFNQWRDARRLSSVESGSYTQLNTSDNDIEAQRNAAFQPNTSATPSNKSRFTGPTSFVVGVRQQPVPTPVPQTPAPINQHIDAPSYQQSMSHPSANVIDEEEEQLRLAIEKSINET